MWHNFSSICIFHRDREADIDIGCRVFLSVEAIELIYDEQSNNVMRWSGKAVSPGHFELIGNAPGCKGTFHCFEGSGFIEGFWKERGFTGMWRVTLKK